MVWHWPSPLECSSFALFSFIFFLFCSYLFSLFSPLLSYLSFPFLFLFFFFSLPPSLSSFFPSLLPSFLLFVFQFRCFSIDLSLNSLILFSAECTLLMWPLKKFFIAVVMWCVYMHVCIASIIIWVFLIVSISLLIFPILSIYASCPHLPLDPLAY